MLTDRGLPVRVGYGGFAWALILLALLASGCNSASSPSEPPPPSGQVPIGGEYNNDACFERAEFPDPDDSPYVLPYRVGDSHRLLQSYCDITNSHRGQLAYDILMPIGDDILAIAAGTVRQVKESWPDDGVHSQNHNFVLIEHDDGTTAFYAHLMQRGVDVEIGERVSQGQRIAASGMSAVPVPLLHLGVYAGDPRLRAPDVAFNFRNAEGALDARGGLQVAVDYLALPY